MPNTFIDNRDRWMQLSDVDYLGQFVKAWLALNAWYRSAYAESQDRKIINEFKWQSNPVLSRLRPLLSGTITTEESEQFRSNIGLLHHRLQNYEIHTGKGDDKQRVSLENIFIRDNPPCAKTHSHQGYAFRIERSAGGQMTVSVTNRSSVVILTYNQPRHDFSPVTAQPGFAALSTNLKGVLRGLYEAEDMKPKLITNLSVGMSAPIRCGAYEFRCSPEFLFAGVVEAIYAMRCTLFHGELNPTQGANACYEPAYLIVRRFLNAIA